MNEAQPLPGFEQVNPRAISHKDFPAEGLVGEYKGTKTVQIGNRESTQHLIGTTRIWGTTSLNRALETVPTGTTVQVIYRGKGTTEKGNPCHFWDVYIKKESNAQSCQAGPPPPGDDQEIAF